MTAPSNELKPVFSLLTELLVSRKENQELFKSVIDEETPIFFLFSCSGFETKYM